MRTTPTPYVPRYCTYLLVQYHTRRIVVGPSVNARVCPLQNKNKQGMNQVFKASSLLLIVTALLTSNGSFKPFVAFAFLNTPLHSCPNSANASCKTLRRITTFLGSATSSNSPASSTSMGESEQEECASLLTLLEHVNLNIPEHKYALPFYLDILGFGLDPRRAQNVAKGSGTVWYVNLS